MEPLPTQGQTLRHYTASRPRPRRTHTQPPSSRPQDPVSKVENEADEGMGRVDEGVEEFFSKKIIPDYALKGQWEESIPAQATPTESSSTPSAPTTFSSLSNNITSSTTTTVTSPFVPSTDTSFTSTDVSPLSTSSPPPAPSTVTTTPLPTKNIKKKFGDFFAFKKARAGRATKAGGGEGGGREGMKVKRTSIADLIRPLREAKERERERDREKGRGARSVEDANASDAATTQGTVATSHHIAGDVRGTVAPAKTLTTMTPSSETAPTYPTIATGPDLTAPTLSNLEEEAAPVLPGHTPSPVFNSPLTEERGGVHMKDMKLGEIQYGEKRLKVTKRSLREGKSQSLILLTGLEPEDKDDTHSKKHASESTSSFEQRLQVMLHRMGVAKTPPADTKASQNKDEELRKANSEGAILDKPMPPPTYLKPRTMSTSSDPRHPMRALDHIRPDPLPKPALPERPVCALPSKPAIPAKPPLPTPASPAAGTHPSSAPPSSSSTGRVQLRAHTHDSKPGETTVQNGSQEHPWRELLPPALSPWRGPSSQDRSEKAQSVTEESLPKPRQHLKPLPQRRAVSVHEDTLAMTQELKAVLQRSPIHFRGLPTCTEDPSSGKEAQRPQEGDGASNTRKWITDKKKEAVQKEELKVQRRRMGCEIKHPPPGEEESPGSECPSSTAQAQQEAPTPRPLSQTAAPDKAPSTLNPAAQIQSLEKPPVTPPSEKKTTSTAQPLPQTPDKLLVSPPPQVKTPSTVTSESTEKSQVSHKKKSPGTVSSTVDERNSTQERGEAVSKEHTMKAEPADQRTEPPPV